jgi:hypothetical protein
VKDFHLTTTKGCQICHDKENEDNVNLKVWCITDKEKAEKLRQSLAPALGVEEPKWINTLIWTILKIKKFIYIYNIYVSFWKLKPLGQHLGTWSTLRNFVEWINGKLSLCQSLGSAPSVYHLWALVYDLCDTSWGLGTFCVSFKVLRVRIRAGAILYSRQSAEHTDLLCVLHCDSILVTLCVVGHIVSTQCQPSI